MITELSELQQVMFFARYNRDDPRGHTTVGWSHVLSLRDLSLAMPNNIKTQANHLYEIWQENNAKIAAIDSTAYKTIDEEIDQLKAEILAVVLDLR